MAKNDPNERFIRFAEIDGVVHRYDIRTHVFERRRGAGRIPAGRAPGWVVGRPFNGNGLHGMYRRSDALVLRPKRRDEIAQDAEARRLRWERLRAKRALPWAVRMVLAHSAPNRKGVLRCSLWEPEEEPGRLAQRLLPGFRYEVVSWVVRFSPGNACLDFYLVDGGDEPWDRLLCGMRFRQVPRRMAKQMSRADASAVVASLHAHGVEAGVWVAYDLSPYGPRTRKILKRMGLTDQEAQEAIYLYWRGGW